MFRKFKEFSTEIKTTVKKEEKDGRYEDETCVHRALVKHFKENNEPLPVWLNVRVEHDSITQNGSRILNKFGSNLSHSAESVKGQVEGHLKPRTSRFGSQSPQRQQQQQQQQHHQHHQQHNQEQLGSSYQQSYSGQGNRSNSIPVAPLQQNYNHQTSATHQHINGAHTVITNNLNTINSTAKSAVSTITSRFSSNSRPVGPAAAAGLSSGPRHQRSESPSLVSSSSSSSVPTSATNTGSPRPSFGASRSTGNTGARPNRFTVKKTWE
ncbi:hypothetical protein CANARDRAFT_26000 [[Candida] arabinofermentans NRRL YB-2248]|uniref:Mso1 N-terminal domain-containing protein n=1 Tax=[Candida] arabinofermentans NRRL YB-2248 TaxID=983967 RepID=A0A1E4T7S2_9ASCO|nr:hypothetical protein CANARDRAFT_26000 [[Candida] arabinofermentans NRRL YB-2248]